MARQRRDKMEGKNIFSDTMIHVLLETDEKTIPIPLRLQINEKGIIFSARLKDGQEPNLISFDLLELLDEHLHKLGIPEKPGEDIKKSGRIIISF